MMADSDPWGSPQHPSAAWSTAELLIPSISIQGATEPFHARQGSLLLPKNTLCVPKEWLTEHWTGRDLHRKVLQEGNIWVMILGSNYKHNKAQGLVPKWECLLLLGGAGDPVQTPAWATLTGDAGDAEHMSVADSELVHHCARLVGINNHDFTGWQRASKDPDTAGCGIHLMELLCLQQSRHTWVWSALLLDQPEPNSAWQHLHMVSFILNDIFYSTVEL